MFDTLKTIAAAAIMTVCVAGAGTAAQFDGLINPNSDGLGVPQATYDFGAGVTLGVAGLRNAEVGDEISLSIINNLAAVQSGSFLGLFVKDASIFNEAVSAGDEVTGTLTLASGGTLFDSLFVSYGSNVVTQSPGNGTTTFGTEVRVAGLPDAFAPSPVPLPAALPMLVAALGGMGFVARRKAA